MPQGNLGEGVHSLNRCSELLEKGVYQLQGMLEYRDFSRAVRYQLAGRHMITGLVLQNLLGGAIVGFSGQMDSGVGPGDGSNSDTGAQDFNPLNFYLAKANKLVS